MVVIDLTNLGKPLGFKVNVEDLVDGRTLQDCIDKLKSYHNGNYVVGYDTLYVDKPHYHIHFFTNKKSRKGDELNEGTIKTFRTNVFTKNGYSRASKLYFGRELPSGSPLYWLTYAIKENVVSVEGEYKDIFSGCMDEIDKQRSVHLEMKKIKKIHNEKEECKRKETLAFKDKLFKYVDENINNKEYLDEKYDVNVDEPTAIKMLIVKYLMEENRYGSLQKHYIERLMREYLGKSGKWDFVKMYKHIFN